MPYGNKGLHFGHVGGVFVQADAFARFLRDRLGAENVIFVSGTDCYGSPIAEAYRQASESGEFGGTLEDFVRGNHLRQREVLRAYHVEPNLFAASGLAPFVGVHKDLAELILRTLHANGFLLKLSTPQFYDPQLEVFLNGRQVEGRCPMSGCGSEKAYADECSLGHQYEPKELLEPRSVLTGNRPEMRDVTNWYVDVPAVREQLGEWVERIRDSGAWRPFAVSSLAEYFEPPTIHITRDQAESLETVSGQLPPHRREPGRGKSIQLVFDSVAEREKAVVGLAAAGIRYRTGKTLVPFRLTGNLEWGLPAPSLEGLEGLTFWVWPESLWAPVSFCAAYLEQTGRGRESWTDWWCSPESWIYQFIGEDNVYFYGLPQGAIWLGMQGSQPVSDPGEGDWQLTHLVANRHLLFLDKKASSSGKVKPPMAGELLEHYTPEQLRVHFFGMALGRRGVNFKPKPFNPAAKEKEPDPVLKESKVICNAFNRHARSCFYTIQKFRGGRIPGGTPTVETATRCEQAILDFEEAMLKHEFPTAFVVCEDLIRDAGKAWSAKRAFADDCAEDVRCEALVEAFHYLRVATTLMHPIVPEGTEMIRQYLNVGEELWSWDRIFQPLSSFIEDCETHRPRFLEPRVDFFPKHPSQFA
jgi:methionyl-tRNA synthetase